MRSNIIDLELVWLAKPICEFDDATGVLALPEPAVEQKGLV